MHSIWNLSLNQFDLMKWIKLRLISERISKSFLKYPKKGPKIVQSIMMANSEIKVPLNIMSYTITL